MSHKATYWLATVDPKRITSGAFRVLFHLCDHHNDTRDPETACFPSQETLMNRTGLSNGGLNKCIDQLEQGGLLRRRRATAPGTPQRRTYYILGCDHLEGQEQTPLSGDSANSTPVEPALTLTPLLDGANSTFEGGKLHPSGEEPVKEPVNRNLTPYNPPSPSQRDVDEMFETWWQNVSPKKGKGSARGAFKKALKKASLDELIQGIRAYQEFKAGSNYVQNPSTWLNDEGWLNEYPTGQNIHDQLSQQMEQAHGIPTTRISDCSTHQRLPSPVQETGQSGHGAQPYRNQGYGGSNERQNRLFGSR